MSSSYHVFTVKNKRYRVPESFLHNHPGGYDLISLGINRNCTELFISYHSMCGDKPERILQQWYYEDCKQGDIDYFDHFNWMQTPFYDELKSEVRHYFSSSSSEQRSYKATTSKWIFLFTMMFAAILSFYGFVHGWWITLITMPLFYWMGPACMLHDGTHSSLSSTPWVNQWCARVGTLHMNPFSWFHQHVIAHHAYTNIRGADPDIQSFDGVPGGIYGHRSTPFTPYRNAFRRWLRSLFITMPFSCLQPALKQDWNVWWNGTYDYCSAVTVPVTALQRLGHFALRWTLFGILIVGIPFWCIGGLKGVAFALVPSFVYGGIYYIFSQISHVNEDCFVHHQLGGEWAVWQIQHSLDYATQSTLWRALSIALNLQTIHHLFPQIDSSHYASLSLIVQRLCKKHHIKMNILPGVTDAIKAHFLHIWAINSEINMHQQVRKSK